MEGSAAVYHLVEEFHGQRDQLVYSVVATTYRHSRKQCVNGNFGYLDMEMMKLIFTEQTYIDRDAQSVEKCKKMAITLP